MVTYLSLILIVPIVGAVLLVLFEQMRKYLKKMRICTDCLNHIFANVVALTVFVLAIISIFVANFKDLNTTADGKYVNITINGDKGRFSLTESYVNQSGEWKAYQNPDLPLLPILGVIELAEYPGYGFDNGVPEECLEAFGCNDGASVRFCGEPTIKLPGFSLFALFISLFICQRSQPRSEINSKVAWRFILPPRAPTSFFVQADSSVLERS